MEVLQNNMEYTFKGQPITNEQADAIRTTALLGKSGLINNNQASTNIATILLTKPSGFQQQLNDYLTGKIENTAPQAPKPYTGYLQEQNNRISPTPTPSTTIPSEPQGSFGLGTGEGQLFGHGGLIYNMTQPFRQGLINPAATLIGTISQGGLNMAPEYSNDPRYKVMPGDTPAQLRAKSAALQQARDLTMINPNSFVENQTPVGVTQQEMADYFKNPLLGGIKAGVGIASYGVPVGGASTILGTAGRGALAGAGMGFGSSRPGSELNDTLAGGAGGAIFAGGAKAISPLLSKITSGLTNKLEGNILNVDPNKLKYSKYVGVTGAKQLENDAIGVLKDVGVNPMTKIGTAQAIDAAIPTLQEQLTQQTANSNKLFDTGSIIDKVKTLFKNNPDIISKNQEPLLNLIDMGDKVNASDLAKYYFDIQNQINFNRSTGAVPETERLLRGLQDTIGGMLKDSETGVPGLSKTLNQLSILHEAQPFATKTATVGTKLLKGVPILSQVNSAPITDVAQTVLGRTLKNGFIGQSTILPRLGAMGAIQQSKPQVDTSLPSLTTPLPAINNTIDVTTAQPDMLKQIILGGVTSGNLTPVQGKAYLDLFGQSGQKQLSLVDRQKVDAAKQGLQELNNIAQYFTQGNAITSNLPAFLQSNESQQLEQAIANASDLIARARTGAAINNNELALYRSMFPVFGDTKETVNAKLQRIYNELAGTASYGQ